MDLIYRFDPYAPLHINRPANAEKAIESLLQGNQRLVDIVQRMQHTVEHGTQERAQTIVPVDLTSWGLPFLPGAALDQAPYALVLGCSDARVPIESIFDQSFNDLFVVRIAGNVLGTECLGSFDYAVRHLNSLQAVVVLGHTGCGAVSAAVASYLNPNDYAEIGFTHALRSLVDRVLAAVRGAAHAFERRCGHDILRHPNFRSALVEAAVYLNAAITAFELQRAIRNNERNSSLKVFYGACNIATMVVQSEPSATDTSEPHLKPAPPTTDDFERLADGLVQTIAQKLLN